MPQASGTINEPRPLPNEERTKDQGLWTTDQRRRTKDKGRTKPKRLKLFRVNKMSLLAKKQTQMGYSAFFQTLADRNRPVLEENGWSSHRIAAETRANPNKPKWHKANASSKIDHDGEDQTQARYQACFHEFAAPKWPIFEENG